MMLFSVFSVNVDSCNCAFENTHGGSFSAGFYNAGLLFDAYDLADDSADRGDLITYNEVVAHALSLFFLLFLRADHEEIENEEENCHHTDGDQGFPTAALLSAGSSCVREKSIKLKHSKLNVLSVLLISQIIILRFAQYYNGLFVNFFNFLNFFFKIQKYG